MHAYVGVGKQDTEQWFQGRQDQALASEAIVILLAQRGHMRPDKNNAKATALHDQLASEECWPKRLKAKPPGGFIRL